jgi:hypothetical protein
MKKYNIVLINSWMGDTLLASNVVRNITNMGYDIHLYHKWPFMTNILNLFEIKQSASPIVDNSATQILYSKRIDVFDNPLLDYAKCFNIDGVNLEEASKFYSIGNKLKEVYNVQPSTESYITYDSDWNLRTNLNIEHIVKELSKEIKMIPIGGNRFDNDPNPLIESAKILVNSKLHLGMVGGTTNFATFLDVKCIGDTSHLYNFYKNRGHEHEYYGGPSLNPENFLELCKPLPNNWADKKHVINNPLMSEQDFIQTVKNNL